MAESEFVVSSDQLQSFRDNGYLVIENVFTEDECQNYCNGLITNLRKLNPNLKVNMQSGKADEST
jgi:hypothetical protein